MTVESFFTDDGCRIAYDYHMESGKPVLMLSPSLGTAMALFDLQMEALSPHFSILRYDPRGHGASDAPEGGYSLDRLGRDVICLLDHLEIGYAHFAGVSLGGMTGQWLGYQEPGRIGGLILANTSAYMGPPSGWEDRITAVLNDGMGPVVEPVLQRWFTPVFRKTGSSAISDIRALLETTKPTGYAGCSAAIRDMDLRTAAPLITARTLVIAGLQDPATTPDHAAFLAAKIPAAERVNLDAAHLCNVELPEVFSDTILKFLRG